MTDIRRAISFAACVAMALLFAALAAEWLLTGTVH